MSVNVTKIAQYDGNKGLTQRQAVETANQRKLNLLTNKQFDERLVLTDTWKKEKEVYPAWSGTLGAYESPRKKLANIIQYTDPETKVTYTFEVPQKMQGAKDIALAVNHMVDAQGRPLITYENKGENDVIVKIADQSKIKVVEDFPRSDGWYATDPEFGIPTGSKISSSNSDARYLWQVDGGSYVGLAARRYYGFNIDVRRDVLLVRRPSDRAGVLGMESGAQAPAAPEIKSNGQPNLKELAVNAENALNNIVGKVDEVFVKPIRALVDAAKQ